MIKKKVAFIVPMLAPYRVTFFTKLVNSTQNLYDWKIFFGLKQKEDGRPAYQGDIEFPYANFTFQKQEIGPWTLYKSITLENNIKEFNPDIIVMLGNSGIISNRNILRWAKKLNKQTILWVCDWDSGKSKHIFRWLKRILTQKYYKKADYFITYSSHCKRFLEDMSIPSSKIKIAYNGIETENYLKNNNNILQEGQQLRIRENINQQTKLFLYVGGLLETKRVLQLIKAFKQLNQNNTNIKLWIVGDGPLKNQVLSAIHNDPNIKYWGRIIDKVDSYFAAADWFVLPGCGGLALNQAMIWGVPCICSIADGTEEDLIIDDFSGYRFDHNSENSLIDTMQKVIKISPKDYNFLSINSKNLIIRRSNVDKMVEIFSEVIHLSANS